MSKKFRKKSPSGSAKSSSKGGDDSDDKLSIKTDYNPPKLDVHQKLMRQELDAIQDKLNLKDAEQFASQMVDNKRDQAEASLRMMKNLASAGKTRGVKEKGYN